MPVNLDDLQSIHNIDSAGMLECVHTFPQQLEDALNITRDWKINTYNPINIVILGLGGSAIGGDLLRAYLLHQARIPIQVCRDYNIPEFVNNNSLVLVPSYSGNTEETLSAYEQARGKGAHLIAYSTGGLLQQKAERDGISHFKIPAGYQPRAALGYAFVSLLITLQKMQIIVNQDEVLQETLQVLKDLQNAWQPVITAEQNLPKTLAQQLLGKIPVIYGSQDETAVIAYRWRCQFNENSKVLVSHHYFPELNHNEIVGWSGIRENYERLAVIFLRYPDDYMRITKRIELTKEFIAGKAPVEEIFAWGKSRLAKMFSLIYLGDLTSVYLAVLQGIDPTPVKVINWLKGELAKI
jgi:glucose/mannose-6-phosphate isomerase